MQKTSILAAEMHLSVSALLLLLTYSKEEERKIVLWFELHWYVTLKK